MIDKLILSWKWLAVIGVLIAALGTMTSLYLGKRDDLQAEKANFKSFVARTEELGSEAAAKKKLDDETHAANLVQIRKDHEAKVPEIRAAAVANYLARRLRDSDAGSGGGALLGDGAGLKLDDANQRECVPDAAFIQECGVDAEKVAAWQDYCRLNHCPVKD